MARKQITGESPIAQVRVQQSLIYRESLAAVNRKLGEARAAGLDDGHPDVRKLQEERKQLDRLIEGQLRSETTTMERHSNAALQTLGATAGSLEAQLRAARMEIGALDRTLGRYKRVATDSPKVDMRIRDLNHRLVETQAHHAQIYDRLKKAEVQLELERVSVASRYEVVTPARLDRPRRSKLLVTRVGLGVAIGFALLVGFVMYREGGRALAGLIPPGAARAGRT